MKILKEIRRKRRKMKGNGGRKERMELRGSWQNGETKREKKAFVSAND